MDSNIRDRIAALSPEQREALLGLLAGESSDSSRASITRRETADNPLSFGQKRLWFLNRMQPDHSAYNIPGAFRVEGRISTLRLQACLQQIVDRHDVLRTYFPEVSGEPTCVVQPRSTVDVDFRDLTALEQNDRERETKKLVDRTIQRSFDLERGPLLRASLLQIDKQESILLITMHHIVSDGWSVSIIYRELATLYAADDQNSHNSLPDLEIQYIDFAAWQRDWMLSEGFRRQMHYWCSQLSNLPNLNLPLDRKRGRVQTHRGATCGIELSKSLSEHFQSLCQDRDITLTIGLLAAFKLLLSSYSGQLDIAVGSPIANRNRHEIEQLVGFFVNTLVLRTNLAGDPTFNELLERVREVALGAYDHQDLPFERLVEELQPERDLSKNPLFQVLFAVQNAPFEELRLKNLRITGFPFQPTATRFDLELHVWERNQQLQILFFYNCDLFDESSIQRMSGQFRNLLQRIVEKPDRRLSDLLVMGADERQQIDNWNATEKPHQPQCIHHLFEIAMRENKDAIAVRSGGSQQISYGALDALSDRISRYLLSNHAIGPDDVVAICLRRNAEAIAAILGILKCGAAYLPIDPDSPSQRTRAILDQAMASVLLTQNELSEDADSFRGTVVDFDTIISSMIAADGNAPTRQGLSDDVRPSVQPENLAYIICTSGSTGAPKGVAVEHRNVSALIQWARSAYSSEEIAEVAASTSLGFDLSIFEIFVPLCTGGTVVFVENAIELFGCPQRHHLTLINTVPTALESLLAQDAVSRSVCTVNLAGEPLTSSLADEIYRRSSVRRVYDLYGPSEDTTYSTQALREPNGSATIGRPIDNTSIHLLDRYGNQVVPGVFGEMHIAGQGLVRGYLNNPQTTANSFLPNDFANRVGARLYRTGDLARYRPDGSIDFLGRRDHQIKLRGYRIELGEIESCLQQHPNVLQVVVELDHAAGGERSLVAYVAPNDDGDTQVVEENLHVENWKTIYEDVTYESQKRTAPDPTFDTSGWVSAYTGNPIPAEEMREQVDSIVSRIQQFGPEKILEIGCGTGLLLFPLARHCQTFWGTDFSQAALKHVRENLSLVDTRQVDIRLLECTSDDFTEIDDGSFDVVVLNSVVQYFPSLRYLHSVLTKASRVVRKGGKIVVGDVRNLKLLRPLHTSIQLHRAGRARRLGEIKKRVQQQLHAEQELIIDPAFFSEIVSRIERVDRVEIQLKRGTAQNELTKFRYDVIIHVGDTEDLRKVDECHDWRKGGFTVGALENVLANQPASLAIKDIPDARCFRDVLCDETLHDTVERPVESDRNHRLKMAGDAVEMVDPESIHAVADKLGYNVELRPSTRGHFDALFCQSNETPMEFPLWDAVRDTNRSWHKYSNNPLLRLSAPRLTTELRTFLRTQLPDYMVPSFFEFLPELPRTASGKIDRRSLPKISRKRQIDDARIDPQNELESRLRTIWQDVLNLDQVGVRDNFFDLGGHSLRLVHVHSRVKDELGVDITVVDLFEFPTIESLARHLSNLSTNGDNANSAEPQEFANPATKDDARRSTEEDAIAIVGMSGRFPGADSIDALWQLLENGQEGIQHFTHDELLAAGIEEQLLQNPNYVLARGCLDGADYFDAEFFGYTPREAEIMDPQHRVFLECAWSALENAGYDPARGTECVGVFGGCSVNTYLANVAAQPGGWNAVGGLQALISNDKDFLPSRVSYKLNLRGPSVNVQTACSTSLVAIHYACRSLLRNECDIALAGGSSVMSPLISGYLYEPDSIQSQDGHCRAFSSESGGTVKGDGVAIVALKRLSEARADGDTIHAVILGTAINNDGSRKVGYTAPSVDGQAEVIRHALEDAQVDPDSIGFVEAHGTATPLGDPVEVAALTKAFRTKSSRTEFCELGSIKSNLGHLDAAAGVAGLIKATLMLKHRKVVPSLYVNDTNPTIDFQASPFRVSRQCQTLEPSQAGVVRGGVSSFGIGGTNAHVILEEAPPLPSSEPTRKWKIIPLSAKHPDVLNLMSQRLAHFMQNDSETTLSDIAYTLQVGRSEFSERSVAIAKSKDDAIQLLGGEPGGRVFAKTSPEKPRRVVFMFPGQGAQYRRMGAALYRQEAVFRQIIDQCADQFHRSLGLDLHAILMTSDANAGQDDRSINSTELAQPALFAVELGLARLLIHWGIQPAAVIGHSLGEYVAACVAEVLSVEDAIELVSQRSQLMASAPVGAMLAVTLPEDELHELLDSRLSIAAINSPEQCVVSGSVEAIDQFMSRLQQLGLPCHRLPVTRGFHSQLMDDVLPQFAAAVDRVELNEPKIPMVSNVTGDWIANRATDPSYWCDHLRHTVRFSQGISTLLSHEAYVLLEVGPGETLCNLTREHSLFEKHHTVLRTLPNRNETIHSDQTVATALGRLWLEGIRPNWNTYYESEQRQRVGLPTYPFRRQRFWIDAGHATQAPSRNTIQQPASTGEWQLVLQSWIRSSGVPCADSADNSTILIFGADDNLSNCLQSELEVSGQRVLRVVAGDSYDDQRTGVRVIDVSCRTDYERLFSELQDRDETVSTIIYLEPVATCMSKSKDDLTRCLEGLSHLANALQKADFENVQLMVVTANSCDVVGSEQVSPVNAALLGFCRAMRDDSDHVSWRVVDVLGNDDPKRLAAQLSQNAFVSSQDALVALRGGYRWVAANEHRPMVNAVSPKRLRDAGNYIVLGALDGGGGWMLAEALATKKSVNLFLTGSERFPRPSEWKAWLAQHGEDTPVSLGIRRLQTLQENGTQIEVGQVDLKQQQAVENFLRGVLAVQSQIHGVVYAFDPLEAACYVSPHELDSVNCAKQLGDTSHALSILQGALQGISLDFFLLLTSPPSEKGVTADRYAMVRSITQCFSSVMSRTSPFAWQCLDWEYRHFADRAHSTKELIGEEPTELLDAIEQALSTNGHVTLASTDNSSHPTKGRATKAASADESNLQNYTRTHLSAEHVGPRTATERLVASVWQEAMGIDQIGIHENFFELGGHSLLATQLMSRLRETLLVELPLAALYESPTIAELSVRVEEVGGSERSQQIEVAMQRIQSMTAKEKEDLMSSHRDEDED